MTLFFAFNISTHRTKLKITKIPAKAGTNIQIKNIQPKYVDIAGNLVVSLHNHQIKIHQNLLYAYVQCTQFGKGDPLPNHQIKIHQILSIWTHPPKLNFNSCIKCIYWPKLSTAALDNDNYVDCHFTNISHVVIQI